MMDKNSFSNNDVVIKPIRDRGEPLICPDAIIVAVPSELKHMVDISRAQRQTKGKSNPFNLFMVKGDNNLPLALAGPVLGAPQGVIVMEKLIALGAKRIWLLGWCGSLQPYLLIGDLIIPATALSEEGASAHYPVREKRKQTSPFLNKRLENALSKANLYFKKGPIWTTDAVYRETKKKVVDYGKQGILAVEMEMSALINLAVYRSVEVTGLLIVSDELFSLEWHKGYLSEKLKKRTRQAGCLILDICMNSRPEDSI
ncbi:MAG TPA: nucleoside phosphorylase [Desulfatiglandales bacterium]|nr:nucleoside phosphorylase [Desulfatiglandales bacterium]